MNYDYFRLSAKPALALDDLHDTTCMTHNRFSNFNYVSTIVQVAQTKFI